MSIDARLQELSIHLPAVAKPVAAYVPAVTSGNQVFVSGQLPFVDGELTVTGRVGDEVEEEQAYDLARICAINLLAALKAEIGTLDKVTRVVKVEGFVASTPDYHMHPKVINGASELLGSVFGEKGKHARAAVGVAALPLNAPVEVAAIFEVDG